MLSTKTLFVALTVLSSAIGTTMAADLCPPDYRVEGDACNGSHAHSCSSDDPHIVVRGALPLLIMRVDVARVVFGRGTCMLIRFWV